jgi:hypothetical protein
VPFSPVLLRGVKKVRAEWAMICTNVLKLFTLAKAACGGGDSGRSAAA